MNIALLHLKLDYGSQEENREKLLTAMERAAAAEGANYERDTFGFQELFVGEEESS